MSDGQLLHYLNHHSPPHYLNRHSPSHYINHLTHMLTSTLPQPSLTGPPPHYLNHHSQRLLHTTSSIIHKPTLPQPSLSLPHYLNHHSHSSSILPQSSLTLELHATSTMTHKLTGPSFTLHTTSTHYSQPYIMNSAS